MHVTCVCEISPCIHSYVLSPPPPPPHTHTHTHSHTDLYGLVVFLGVDPYSQLFWFNRLVWHPFMLGREGPMISLFSKLMWRNSKADVADEVQKDPAIEISLSCRAVR